LLKQPGSVPVLIELLRSPNPHVRCYAAGFLYQLDPPPKQAIPALLEAWQQYKGDIRRDLESDGSFDPDVNRFYTPEFAADTIRQAIWQIDPETAKQAGIPKEAWDEARHGAEQP
jgi:hypothetical protein